MEESEVILIKNKDLFFDLFVGIHGFFLVESQLEMGHCGIITLIDAIFRYQDDFVGK